MCYPLQMLQQRSCNYKSAGILFTVLLCVLFFSLEDGFSQEISSKGTFTAINDPKNDRRMRSQDPGSTDIREDAGMLNNPEGDLNRSNTELEPVTVKSEKLAPWKKKNIQEISRQTMTSVDLKEVPASFGDSISALTALPGIIRTAGGIFGPLIIRGADEKTNKYFIDDIPVDSPLHFGGMHSVINTNLMKDIDVYASSFPAEFGSATSAVINISTQDKVDEFSGYSDISLLSVSAIAMTPILRDRSGNIILDDPSHKALKEDTENSGYLIVSGRYGLLGLAIKAADAMSGEDTSFSPSYWDMQLKTKYKLNEINSFTLLYFGHKDTFHYKEKHILDEGDDPLFSDAKSNSSVISHNLGLYLDSKVANDFSNRLLVYGSMPDTSFYFNFATEGVASWAKDITGHYKPWVYSVKDKFKKSYLSDNAEFRGALEYTYYHFTANGKTIIPVGATDSFNPSDENSFRAYELNERITNHLLAGYAENKLFYNGLTSVLGVRSEYLNSTGQTTFDPRLMLSYELSSGLTLSAAGGHYSYFFQTNPYYFNSNPDIAKMKNHVTPEKSWHMSVGAQKEIDLYTIKVEGFNNYFYDQLELYPHYEADGTYSQGLNSGEARAHGFEIMIRKDTKENQNGLFGWVSYTFTRSKVKTGLPTTAGYAGIASNPAGDIFGDKWTTSGYEQCHNFKLTGGYKLGKHTWSGRFQYYSGFAYTPYTGAGYDKNYHDLTGKDRYYPLTGIRNSKNFPSNYTVDFRYTKTVNRSWGQINWYVEQINVLNKKAKDTQKWYYDRDYQVGVNPIINEDEGFAGLVNFGIEFKF
jgi:hypothetical protein